MNIRATREVLCSGHLIGLQLWFEMVVANMLSAKRLRRNVYCKVS